MKTLWLSLAFALAVAAVGGVILLPPPNAEDPPPAPSPGKTPLIAAYQHPEKPTTTGLPKDQTTLQVLFRARTRGIAPGSATWDGTLTVAGGKVRQIRTRRNDPRDSVDGASWKLATHRRVPRSSGERKKGYDKMPFQDTGLIVTLAGADERTRLNFETAQGSFAMTLDEAPVGGGKAFLKGRVLVERVPNVVTLLSAPTEDDYPSAATGPDGKLFVAYVAFTHGKKFRTAPTIPTPPKDFSFLAEPTGGDQVLLLRQDGDSWTGPLPVTPRGQDVYRTAVAVDARGRAWVFWTARRGSQWDLLARRLDGDKWSAPLPLTDTPGPDIFPAATTDKAGRVWVTWQAFEAGGAGERTNANILAARQEGDGFGKPLVVSGAAGNEWAPAIAASPDGSVAVAWDTYTKGDYDVHARVWSGGSFGKPIPVATSPAAQLRPSVVYDRAGRLWIAYEDGPEKWGKDFGAAEQQGMALYRERSVSVRIWANQRLHKPAEAARDAFVNRPPAGRRPPGPKAGGRFPGNKLAVPRLGCDRAGRVWLAVRSPKFGGRGPAGTVWHEFLAYYQGSRWSRGFVCLGTDNTLDNRPTLLPRPGGGLTLVGSSDGRGKLAGAIPFWLRQQLRKEGKKVTAARAPARWPDRVNNELILAEIPAAPGKRAEATLVPVEAPTPGQPGAWARKERKDVARLRAARTQVGGKEVRIRRGEFHRHTELSGDGGGDGLLMDMWRYAIDLADMDWIGNGDHDNGGGREYSWWTIQKTTDMLTVGQAFVPMFTYERSNRYPDGHRNVVFARRGIRPLPRYRAGLGKAMDDLPADAKRPNSPDTQMLYRYLKQLGGICASHTSGTDMGTDWRDSDRKVEPVVEIYQGDRQNYEMPGAPRSNTAQKSIGGWRPLGFVSRALKMGIRLGFQASSDHISTHMSYCNVWAEAPTREAVLTALKRRHVYGATDNILAEMHSGEHFMGDAFTTGAKPTLRVKLVGTGPFAKVHVIKDGNYVHTLEPGKQTVEFQWTDLAPKAGETSYYYVRGEQKDGELVWISPMWITYKP